MASAISALLETPLSGVSEADAENVNPNRGGAANHNNAALDTKANTLAGIQSRLHDNFWVAYDALDLNQN